MFTLKYIIIKVFFLLVSGRRYLTLLFITFGTLCWAIYSKTLVRFLSLYTVRPFGMFCRAICSTETLRYIL